MEPEFTEKPLSLWQQLAMLCDLKWTSDFIGIPNMLTQHNCYAHADVLSCSQYQDVVDERNIDSVCGYPLCSNPLGPAPKQKYLISVAKKQILDLTERKKFCSAVCYKCSEYFAAQLSTTSLWLRSDVTGRVKVKLLSSVEARKSSEISGMTRGDVKVTAKYTAKSSAQEHRPPLFSQLPKVTAIEEKQPIVVAASKTAVDADLPTDETRQDSFVSATASQISTGSSDPSTTPVVRVDTSLLPEPPLSPHCPPPPELTVPPKISQVSKLLGAISTWVSVPQEQLRIRDITTPVQMHGSKEHQEEKLGNVFDGGKEGELVSHDTDTEATMMSRDAMSCDNTGMSRGEEGEVMSHDKKEAGITSRDKGEVSIASHGAATLDQKEFEPSDRSPAEGVSTEDVVFLPPVDGVSVSRIQRSLFNSQLRQHLQRVCSTLNLSFHQVLPQVTKTTSQFRLDRQCITFRVMEWRVLAVLLIVMSCGDVTDVLGNSNVKEWLQAIKATPQDFKLMLAAFR